MKAVMKSVSPRICEKVANGDCTVLVSKTAPKCGVPFKCYIYATKGTADNSLLISKDGHHVILGDYRNAFNCDGDGNVDWNIGNAMVIGEFVCDNAEWLSMRDCDKACMTLKEAVDYAKGKKLYGWYISDLKIYDKPKELTEFKRPCSYKGTCYYCDRASFENDGTRICDSKINRAAQSWQYVEEL